MELLVFKREQLHRAYYVYSVLVVLVLVSTRVVLNHENGICEHYYNNLNFRAIFSALRFVALC